MRIIAGEHRGRTLLGPADERTTRPITDRVKQSVFDRLAAAERIERAIVADFFAGTGSIGLECLSRGAEHVSFVERDREAVRRLMKNLEAIGQTEQADVLRMDALGQGVIDAFGERRFSLLFIDPPYPLMRGEKARRVWRQIDRLRQVAAEDALLVLRTPRDAAVGEFAEWRLTESRTYNMMTVHLLA